MQSLSAKIPQGRSRFGPKPADLGPEAGAIGRIAQDRVPDMGEVHPDLVGAAGFQSAGQQAGDRLAVGAGELLEQLPMRDSGPSVWTHRLPVARVLMAAEWGVDRAL